MGQGVCYLWLGVHVGVRCGTSGCVVCGLGEQMVAVGVGVGMGVVVGVGFGEDVDISMGDGMNNLHYKQKPGKNNVKSGHYEACGYR